MNWARQRGSQCTALLGTSYGAWILAFTFSVEMTEFTILILPIADIFHATVDSSASWMMAGLLKRNGVQSDAIARHAHLTSSIHLNPLTPAHCISIIERKHDRLLPSEHLKALSSQ